MPDVATTPIGGLLVITPSVFTDDRGWFFESFNEQTFVDAIGGSPRFLQDNSSRSMRGVLRGLHYQLPPKSQGKLIQVTSGAVIDVAVDIRKSSATFGKWYSLELSDENHKQRAQDLPQTAFLFDRCRRLSIGCRSPFCRSRCISRSHHLCREFAQN